MALRSFFSGIFGSGNGKTSPASETKSKSIEHHVRIVVADFGPVDQFEFEDRIVSLVEAVPGGEFDGTGTDLGTGEREIFLYGPDANALVDILLPYLIQQSASGAKVKLFKREGSVDLELTEVKLG